MIPNLPPCLRMLYSAAQIQQRVAALGRQISRDYAHASELRLIGVLKGAWIFFADLVRRVEVPVTCDFIGVSSYGGTTIQSGALHLTLDITVSVAGVSVVLVEDIVDTGLTVQFLSETLAQRGARDIRTCALLDKPGRRRVAFQPDYVGFTIPNYFVVGYGLDVAERYRQLPYLAIYPGTPCDDGAAG